MNLSLTAVTTVSLIAYFSIIIINWHKPLQQQISFLTVFLAGTAIIGELDVLLSVYFVVSFLPLIPKMRKVSRFTALFLSYILLYLLYGIIWQDAERSLVMFIAKIWQFAIFFLIMDQSFTLEENIIRRAFTIAIITETVLGVYLFFNSTMTDSLSGLVRLVSNSQPISGNFSTVLLPLSVYYYKKKQDDKKAVRFILWANLYFLIWIVLSGTRGYILEYVVVMGCVFLDYFSTGKLGSTVQINRLLIISLLGVAGVILIIVIPEMLERVSRIMRLNASVGIRTYENAATLNYLKHADLLNLFFGIGFGGTAAANDAMLRALHEQFSLGMWNYAHYLYVSGPIFHSLYSNIALTLGIVGIAVTFHIFVKMWKIVNRVCNHDSFIRRAMHFFQLGFFIMNYYRWSADCGITEMIIFAMVLKMIQTDKNAITLYNYN